MLDEKGVVTELRLGLWLSVLGVSNPSKYGELAACLLVRDFPDLNDE